MTITNKTIEAKKEELEKQFNELTSKLKELENAATKIKADATAVNGAIQVCNQLLAEEQEDDKDEN